MVVQNDRNRWPMDDRLSEGTPNPLAQFILDKAGIALRVKDYSRLQRFLNRRLADLQIPSLDAYCDRLQASYQRTQSSPQLQSQEEWIRLMQEITNGESYFFRDPSQLDLLFDTLLPKIITSRQKAFDQGGLKTPYLNIWSAGCSTGEEPYSMAMLIKEKYPALQNWNIHLIATDINPQSIQHAQAGIYRPWSLRETSLQYRSQYFQNVGGDWKISPELTSLIQWDILNLKDSKAIAKRIPWASMDIILCRNVFIYFDTSTIRDILQQFHHCLNPEGYLITGHAELEGQDLSQFQTCYGLGSVIYQTARAPQARSVDKKETAKITRQGASKPNLSTQTDTEETLINWEEVEQLLQGKYSSTVKTKLKNLPSREKREFPYLWTQARLAFNEEELVKAKTFVKQVNKLKPQFIPALMLLVQILQAEQEWDRALACLRKIIFLEPDHIIAHSKLVDVYELMGNKTKARKSLATLEALIKPMSSQKRLNDPIHSDVAKLRTYIEWKKIRHPFYRASLPS